jgi:ubiquinone/menaquinone biosynthesis C-methylase UbiE
MAFKDYFSDHAAGYASYRPHYPAAMFNWLAQQCTQQRNAWDCASGNGQAAVALTPYFENIVATDASHAQLTQAIPHDNIHYVCATAEQAPLVNNSLDLITVAQAAHWFNRTRFYREVDRLLASDGVLALWCYGLFQITPEIDALILDYYQHTLGEYWPPERRHIERAYSDIGFPYVERPAPEYNMQVDWNLAQVMGYLATWSATRLFIKATGRDPLSTLEQLLTAAWGDPQQRSPIHWPIHLKVGSKP